MIKRITILIVLLLISFNIIKADQHQQTMSASKLTTAETDLAVNKDIRPILDDTIIKRLDIPEKSSTYDTVDRLILIQNQEEFEQYLSFDTSQRQYTDEYKKKASYKKLMQLLDDFSIDFENYYLFIACRTETSGSIKVSASEPFWMNDDTIKIAIESDIPIDDLLTNDMAYYGYAYLINKDIKYLNINGKQITLQDGIPVSELSEEEKALNLLIGD